MPASLRAPRGTRDLLPDERAAFARLERTALDLAARYGYRVIETPLFEQAALFERGIGAVTDVVEKELFRVAPSRGVSAFENPVSATTMGAAGAAGRPTNQPTFCARRRYQGKGQ